MPKKLISLILMFITLFSLTSCNIIGNISKGINSLKEATKGTRTLAREKFAEILEALENENEAALKALLSEQSLQESENLDEGIKSFIDLYQGTHIEYEVSTPSSGGHYEKGRRTVYRINVDVELQTEIDKYRIIFDYQVACDDEPEKVGVERLQIFRHDFFYSRDFKGSSAPGIYAITEKNK